MAKRRNAKIKKCNFLQTNSLTSRKKQIWRAERKRRESEAFYKMMNASRYW